MSVIFKREFRSYFKNLTGFIFVAVLVIFTGIFVTFYNFAYLNPSISYALSDLTLVCAVLIPIVTMRLFSEERKSGAGLLLDSLPLKSLDIVLGKYLALIAILALPTALIMILPLIFNFFGDVNYIASYTSILCFFLFGAAILALCMFMSSLTDNTVLCAIFSYITMILLYFVDILIGLIPADSVFAKILSVFSVFSKFEPFMYGIFDIKAIIYYLSVIALFVFLTVRSLRGKRLM